MYLHCLILVVLCNAVLCHECVTENFEKGIGAFTNCEADNRMSVKDYSAVNLLSPHPKSTKFLTPATVAGEWSCVQSPNFTITGGGTLEVNRYTTSKIGTDVMQVEVWKHSTDGTSTVVTKNAFGPSYSSFKQGWDTFRMSIPSIGTFQGAIRFLGRDSGSIIVVDSYRLISPTHGKDSCKIYDEATPTTTSNTTTTTTTSSTTNEPETTTTDSDKSTTRTAQPTVTTTAPAAVPRLSISLQKRLKDFKLDLTKFK